MIEPHRPNGPLGYCLSVRHVIQRLIRRARSWSHRRWGQALQRRIEMTCRCGDATSIAKVPGAGALFRRDGHRVQRMHQGLLVPAGGYYGAWMTEIIRRLRGHHEPQEELLFHHLLPHCRSGTRMLEVGTFWAYYTAWFLSVVPDSTAVCLEPDANNAACGQQTLALNGLTATWVAGAAGRTHAPRVPFQRESDGRSVELPVHSLASLLDVVGHGPVELLHIDAQGAELPFLESLADPGVKGLVRFVVVSTHDVRISGSPTTHEDCLRVIRQLGGTVLEEHTVEESFSGDGLIVASFDRADANLALPSISRNKPATSLFGHPEPPGGSVLLVPSQLGPMVVREADSVIGRSLRSHGRWEEDAVADVVRFLRRTRRFEANTFVAVGANIGTCLLRSLRGGMFRSGVAIEMDPDNFRLLEANVAVNLPPPRPLLLNVAVGDTVGEAVMERAPDNFGDHRIRATHAPAGGRYGEESRRQASVRMTTLEQIEHDNGLQFDNTSLLWIDTQGYEGHVLAGAAGIMGRPPAERPAIVCEFWPYGLERAGGRDRLFTFLQSCGAIHNLNDSHWPTAPPLTLADVAALYDRLLHDRSQSAAPHTDLLCLPSGL